MAATPKQYKLELQLDTNRVRDGYIVYIIRIITFLIGAHTARIYTAPLAQNKDQRDYIVAQSKRTDVDQYAYVDGKYVFVRFYGSETGWFNFAKRTGIAAWAFGKVVKRMKALNRPTLLGGVFADLNIRIVEPTAYTMEHKRDIDALTPEQKDMLLDGWLVISQSLYDRIIEQSVFHVDPLRADMQKKRARKTKVVNIRILLADKIAKGNAAVRADKDMPDGVDVITTSANLKKELTSAHHIFVIAEPQPPHFSVRTNEQTMINLRPLHVLEAMEASVKDHFAQALKKVKNGELLLSFSDIESMKYERMRRNGILSLNDEGITNAMRYAAVEWVTRGLDLRKDPFLLERVAAGAYETLYKSRGRDSRWDSPRIPIPCAWHVQVITASAARMAGYSVRVKRGTITFVRELGCAVVNDLDFVANYANHGGPDLDDFYDLFFRTDQDGRRVVIVVRSPNGWGEYSVYEFVGRDYPTWEKADGSVVEFPKVSLKNMPKRLTDQLADGDTMYIGLPSQRAAASQTNVVNLPRTWSQKDFEKDVDESMETGSVGMYVVSYMLYVMVFGRNPRQMLCSLEDAIDTYTQAGAKDDRQAIDDEARRLLDEVIASGKPIDRLFWMSRGIAGFFEEPPSVNLVDGRLTKIKRDLDLNKAQYVRQVREFGQKSAAAPSEAVHELAKLYRGEATRMLARTRKIMGIINSEKEEIARDEAMMGVREADRTSTALTKGDWERILKPVMDRLAAFDNDVDRYNFAMAWYSVNLTIRTKTREKISTTLVMNNQRKEVQQGRTTVEVAIGPFQMVMDAMKFYGIAATDLFFNEEEEEWKREFVTEWELVCQNCGKAHTTEKATTVQRFHALKGLCKDCRRK